MSKEGSSNTISSRSEDIQHLILDGTDTNDSITAIKTITEGDYSGSQKLQTVQILQGSELKCIGEFAFYGCSALQSVHIDKNIRLEAIETNAFYGCSALQSVNIPNSPTFTHFGSHAFTYCSSLQYIHIPDSVTSIGGNAFEMCRSLQSIHVPGSVKTIGHNAFLCCKSLVSVQIGQEESKGHDGLKTIGHGAFRGCAKLQSINIPKSVRSIGHGAFHGCTKLASIHIPHGVTTIDIHTFCYCESIRSIHIPTTVTTIERYAFRGCISLQSIHVPESVTRIQRNAFHGCNLLEQRRTNSLNYHSSTVTWLRQRFANLPVHQACYLYRNSALVTPEYLSALIEDSKQSLTEMDAMGMMPIHILCCNPKATVDMVQLVKGGSTDLSLLSHTDVSQSTPLHIFLYCRSLLHHGREGEEERERGGEEEQSIPIPSLQDLLKMGVTGEDLDILFVLSGNQEIDFSSRDESTGLLPFMSAAALSECGLDTSFTLAMKNLDTIC